MAGRAYDERRDAYWISRGSRCCGSGRNLVFRDRGQVLRAIAVAVGIDVSFDDLEDRSASP
jgi:hypothetical protein